MNKAKYFIGITTFFIVTIGVVATIWIMSKYDDTDTRSDAADLSAEEYNYDFEPVKVKDECSYKLMDISENGFIAGMHGNDAFNVLPYLWNSSLIPTRITAVTSPVFLYVTEASSVLENTTNLSLGTATGFYAKEDTYISFYWDGNRSITIPSLPVQKTSVTDSQSISFKELLEENDIPQEFLDEMGIHTTSEGVSHTMAYGMNDKQQIVGESNGKAFLWSSSSKQPVDLNYYLRNLGAVASSASDINNLSIITGSYVKNDSAGSHRGFILKPSKAGGYKAMDLGSLGRYDYIDTFRINDASHIIGVGWDSDTDDSIQFIWSNGKFKDISKGVAPVPGFMLATGINNNDDVTAALFDMTTYESSPVLIRISEEVIKDVIYLEKEVKPNEYKLWYASDVNNSGTVVGWGVHRSTGQICGWRLTPVK
ncbi:MAG: hypothetical protein PHS44_01160 [Candidatus Dojkabacteria bacterium]|nr:hypothetical protein [Candidatus Dojkabacteria bacterium]